MVYTRISPTKRSEDLDTPDPKRAPQETALHLQELSQLLRDNAEALLAVMREQFGEQDTRTSRAQERSATPFSA
jgi:hypothetical protein